jgi:hypothetical protein
MIKKIRQKPKFIITISLFIFLCGAWAMAPLWVNPCFSTHLSEDELEQTRTFPNYKNLTPEQQAESDRLHQEAEIPCGAQDLPVRAKLEASRFQGGILDELEILSLLVLRVEFTGMVENTDLYHYKGYTFFFIQVFDAVGGGSGYYVISIWPSLHGGE